MRADRADPSEPSFALDALRAGAALLVLVSHARDMLVRDAAAAPAMSVAGRAFMALSGLGHQAVIVFFVLSGYLVTAAMVRLEAAGRWSLPDFAVRRLTRLWVVLIPCLVLGGCLDALGLAWRGPDAAGAYGIPPVAGSVAAPPALGLGVALANLFFLQTIAAPVFGSNGALWSLANEAWYYGLAGLVFAAWRRRSAPAEAAAFAVAAAVIAAWLPAPILRLAPVWAFGAVAALVPSRHWRRDRRRHVATALLAALAILVAARLRLGPGPWALDMLLGLATAALVRSAAALAYPRRNAAGALVRHLSRLSYSLYASHCPVLALFAAVAIGSERRALDAEALALVAAGCGLCLMMAAAVGWLFERHTGRCRRLLLDRMGGWSPASAGRATQGLAR